MTTVDRDKAARTTSGLHLVNWSDFAGDPEEPPN